MSATTIRVSRETHRILRELAKEANVPIGEFLKGVVGDIQRRRLLAEANAAYAALRNDPEAWAEEQRERALWDSTLTDGLED